MRRILVGAAFAALAATSAPASGQESLPEAATASEALEACIRAAGRKAREEALTAADRAEEAFATWAEAGPGDPRPLVGRARVLSQCRIPFAAFMEQGALVTRSNGLLEEALELDPGHWAARYTLALNHYYTPEFLGRTADAIHHFEVLIEQQGGKTDFPEMARPYAFLGDLYLREGRTEAAVEVWRKGASLFPEDTPLAERLAEHADRALEDDEATTTGAGEDRTSPAAPPDSIEPAYEMDAVVVRVDGGYSMDDARSRATLSRIDVYVTPGGAADIMQVFQTLPGVTRASEGSDLYIRGGDPAETPVLLDGARLLYPGVFETLHGAVFGVLDPSVLRRAYFSSGGFSARWGNALSGVVELETDGRPSITSWRTGWNFAGGGATVRTPVGSRGGAWASIRATETTLLLALHDQADEYPSSPRSLEGVASFVHEPRPGLELKTLALIEGDGSTRDIDAIGYRGPFESVGRSSLALASLRALTPDGDRSLRTTLSWTERRSDLAFGVLDRERTDRGLGARVEAEATAGEARLFRAGLETIRLTGREEGRIPTTDRLEPGAPSEPLAGAEEGAWHLGGWIEAEAHPIPALAVVAGARVDRLPGESDLALDPRLAVALRSGDWTWRLAGGSFHQGRWRTRYALPDEGGPAGVPRRARHLALGVEHEGDPRLKLEAFVKRYDRHVLGEDEGPEVEGGQAAGVDALLQFVADERWAAWFSYSLLRARVDLADGRTATADYDVTHSLTGVGSINFGPWSLGLTGRWSSGRPYTPILGSQPPAEPGGLPDPVYGEPNGARLPGYFRLDGRVMRYLRVPGGLLVAYVEMINLLDRANASTVVYDANFENPRFVDSFFADRTIVAGFELQH